MENCNWIDDDAFVCPDCESIVERKTNQPIHSMQIGEEVRCKKLCGYTGKVETDYEGVWIERNEDVAQKKEPKTDKIYLIVNEDRTVCKIRYSYNPQARLKSLQAASAYPLILHKVIEGTMKQERIIHRKFSANRISGEWFLLNQKIIDFFDNPNFKVATE